MKTKLRTINVALVYLLVLSLIFNVRYYNHQKSIKEELFFGIYSSLLSTDYVLGLIVDYPDESRYDYYLDSIKPTLEQLDFNCDFYAWHTRQAGKGFGCRFSDLYEQLAYLHTDWGDRLEYAASARAIIRDLIAELSVDKELLFNDYGDIVENINYKLGPDRVMKLLSEASQNFDRFSSDREMRNNEELSYRDADDTDEVVDSFD